jgi:hypothetical protein
MTISIRGIYDQICEIYPRTRASSGSATPERGKMWTKSPHFFRRREPDRPDYRTTTANVSPFRRRCDKPELTISIPTVDRALPQTAKPHRGNAASLSSYRPMDRPHLEKLGDPRPYFSKAQAGRRSMNDGNDAWSSSAHCCETHESSQRLYRRRPLDFWLLQSHGADAAAQITL